MANITFSSPIMSKDRTVYAVAGDTKSILAVAEDNQIPIPFECKDGNCGSCLIEVTYLGDNTRHGMALTEKEKSKLKELHVITAAEIETAEVNDLPPKQRLACQFIARNEDVLVSFTGTPGGS